MRLRIVGYIRVSTEEQATSGVSLEAQRAKLVMYCQLHDLELVEVIQDAGVSAKTLDRPGLARALAMLREGHCEGMVVTKLDRLSRSVGDWNILIDSHFGERAGHTLMSVNDSIDTRTAAGRLVLNVLMSVAQWEREAIGERTSEALKHKQSQGQHVGRAGFGYTMIGKVLTPVPLEQSAIRLMQRFRKAGWTFQDIAIRLTAWGVPTQSGAQWHPASVRNILNR